MICCFWSDIEYEILRPAMSRISLCCGIFYYVSINRTNRIELMFSTNGTNNT